MFLFWYIRFLIEITLGRPGASPIFKPPWETLPTVLLPYKARVGVKSRRILEVYAALN